MGFYGNITSASKTQFSFDRIYPNRQKMEENMAQDGIYMGRFVLIDYDQDITKDQYRLFYYENNKFYMFAEAAARTEVKYPGDVGMNEIIRATSDINKDNTIKDNAKFTFWKCTGGNSQGIAQFKKVADAETNYTTNYQIDTEKYGEGRGWDSTVWQKVYTQGIVKYVMIAELNAVIPTFDIVPDAPTLAPIAPHFDQRSNNVYYKLHYQPQWGMRVKSAEGIESDGAKVPSDEKIVWKKEIYNAATDEEAIKYFDGVDWVNAADGIYPTHDGAIYYNKAGFDPAIIAYDSETDDKVAVEATGISGELYNVHNGKNPTEKKPAEDIQEISVMLPSIGNSISQMWDIVYGNKEHNADNHPVDEEGNPILSKIRRNMDLNWDSVEGHRMVKELLDENNDSNGFTYDTERINTLAGSINSVHDLMGMIITNIDSSEEDFDINHLNADNIFYENGKYYRKAKDYEYTEIENSNKEIYEYHKVDNLTSANYQPNTYYLDSTGANPDIDKSFNSSSTYYERILKTDPIGTEANGLVEYVANKYYYKNLIEDFILSTDNKRDEDKAYFTVDFNKITIDTDYEPMVYHKKVENDYILETAEEANADSEYYKISTSRVSIKPYKKDTYYYYYTDETGHEVFMLDSAEMMTADRTYYDAKVTPLGSETILTPGEDGGLVEVEIPVYRIDKKEVIELFDISNGAYYKDGDNFIYTTSIPNDQVSYYTITPGNKINNFYVKGRYYYKYNTTTWRIDTAAKMTEGREYYVLDNIIPITYFYEPNKYYYQSGNSYVIDKSESMTAGRVYYIGEDFYIYDDIKGAFAKYSLWNNNVKTVPCTISLSRRTELYRLEELVGFARSMNTIHGLILEVNKFLEFADEKTRELDTVQGCINKLNDIIFKFDQLIPKEFLVVDNYGRAHSADFSTLQNQTSALVKPGTDETTLLKGVNSDKFAEVDSVGAMRKQWITANIDGNIEKPFVTIHHNFQKVTDTISEINKNTDSVASNNNSDKIELYTPIVDDMGHVVGKNTETVTLPYSFKIITTNGRGTDVVENATGTPENANVVAENTQDTLAINSGNRWIRIDTNASDNSLMIRHDIHNTSASTSEQSLSDETSEDVTFDVPTYSFDEAGHYISHDTKTLTMPFGYGKIVGDNGDTAATATFDTLAFGSDDWLTATVSEDRVVYSHEYPREADDTTSSSDINGNGDTIVIETLVHDEKGHIVNVNRNTVTLPYGYKTFEDSNPTKGVSIAANTQDKFTFEGDSWIQPTVSQSKLAINHIGPVGTAPAAKEALTPNFGATFTLDDWYFDNKGHKYAGGTHTVKIPQPSLNALTTTNASVLTELTLNPTTGAFSQISKNVGELILTGYNKPANGVFEATDSINSAFRKLQDQVITEVSDRGAAITEITGGSTETIASLLRKIERLQSAYDELLAKVQSYHPEEEEII